jgi:hypothetical protein
MDSGLHGNDGWLLALLAGTRRFHCCIQCQDIGLKRDAVDDADDVGDFHARRDIPAIYPCGLAVICPQ